MSYSQVFTNKQEYLLCISDGCVVEVEAFIGWAVAVISKARETGNSKILIDNRTFALDLSPLDVITFVKYLEDMGAVRLGFRLAVLSSPTNVEISRMVETSLTNRSASYKSFKTPEDAKEWLLIPYE